MFLEISQNSQENTCARFYFLIKLQKRDSGTGVFLRILRNFFEHFFYRTPLRDCIIVALFCLTARTREAGVELVKTAKAVKNEHNGHLVYFFWLLPFHTYFAGPDHDITFSKTVCSTLYSKNFFPFKMLSSSNGNDSETYKKTENFYSSEYCGWIESPSSEDKYDPDW